VAVALMDDTTHTPNIVLYIDIRRGYETDANAYGQKKLVFFADDSVESSENGVDRERVAIWDIILDIVPKESTASGVDMNTSIAEGDGNQAASSSNVNYITPLKSGILDLEVFRSSVLDVRDILQAANDVLLAQGENTEAYEDTNDIGSNNGDKELCETEDCTDVDGQKRPSSSVAGYIFSLSNGKDMPEVRQSNVIFASIDSKVLAQKEPSTPERTETSSSSSHWTARDEIDNEITLSRSSETLVDIDVMDITSFSCSHNTLILRSKLHKSHVILASLKQHISTSFYSIAYDLVFEWIRAVAKSGWVIKWPMKKQNAGMRTKRFLILRDRTLSYHKKEPSREEYESSTVTPLVTIKLKSGDIAKKSRYKFLSCVEVNMFSYHNIPSHLLS
jgi:hypothetical protein